MDYCFQDNTHLSKDLLRVNLHDIVHSSVFWHYVIVDIVYNIAVLLWHKKYRQKEITTDLSIAMSEMETTVKTEVNDLGDTIQTEVSEIKKEIVEEGEKVVKETTTEIKKEITEEGEKVVQKTTTIIRQTGSSIA